MGKLKNRYGDEYEFVQIDANTYEIVGDLNYWRFGGKEGQDSIDMADLGLADPSGGPFIQLGMQLFGRRIIRIYVGDVTDKAAQVFIEVEPK